MDAFLDKATTAIDEFDRKLATFRQAVEDKPASSPKFPKKRRKELLDHSARAAKATKKLRQSLRLTAITGLDVVDLQVRLGGEGSQLSSALNGLNDAILDQVFIRESFESELIELEETAEDVGGSIFPSAVSGLRKANVKLWDFSALAWRRYQTKLGDLIQQEKLTSRQQMRVENRFQSIRDRFERADEFLNQLVRDELVGGAEIKQARGQAQDDLRASSKQAAESRDRPVFRGFRGILKTARDTARDAEDLFAKLLIPVLPLHDDLEELKDAISKKDYADASGIGAFAMLNITSRMRSLTSNGRHLLSPAFGISVFRVFPDRIYFRANGSFLEALDDLRNRKVVEKANPALHRFRDGSVKEATSKKGNLQFSYTRVIKGQMKVDADIDLFRNPLAHLFGEVLVNHLTGGDTNQFQVRKILDEQKIAPIGGFSVLGA